MCARQHWILWAALGRLQQRDAIAYERLQPVFISADPARDTPPVLRDYLAYFHPRLRADRSCRY